MRAYELHGRTFEVAHLPSGHYLVTTAGKAAGFLALDAESGDLTPSGRYANVVADDELEALAKVVANDPMRPA
jgi:hypothetical protein